MGLVAVLLLAPVGSASAHTDVDHTRPGAGQVLSAPPAKVEIVFTDPITPGSAAFTVLAPDGSGGAVDLPSEGAGDLLAPATANAVLPFGGSDGLLGFDPAAEGTWVIGWRVLALDGHLRSGELRFSVGETSEVGSDLDSSDSPISLQIAAGVARWAGYLGLSLVMAGFLGLVFFGGAGVGLGGLGRNERRLAMTGALLLVVSALVALALRGALGAGLGWVAVGDGRLITDAVGTTAGRAEITRLLFGLVAALVVRLAPRLDRDGLIVAMVMTLGALGVTYGLTGHASTIDPAWTGIISTMVHALAAATWVGVVLLLLVRRGDLGGGDVGQSVYRRIAVVVRCSVATLAVTGTFQALWIAGWSELFSPYGAVLGLKLVAVAGAIGVGVVLWRWLRGDARLVLAVRVQAEMVMLLGTLALTSVLVATTS